jgi:preprotein translocase subunit Sec61beta
LKFVQTLNKQLEDVASPRAVVYAGLLRFPKTVFANFHLTPINREFIGFFFSKFVQTLNKQLEDGASPRAVVYAGLLRFSKTVFANFHLAPIIRVFMIFVFEICPNPQ